jgi:hypothetical protein
MTNSELNIQAIFDLFIITIFVFVQEMSWVEG